MPSDPGTGTSRHYLDHASTTPLRPEAAAAITALLHGPFADPGRVHLEGGTVRAAVEEARDQVAHMLGVRSRQVVFTSGATEAIHTAVWGAVWERPGGPVLCADVEHSAVRSASGRLAPLITIPVDSLGRIADDDIAATLLRVGARRPALVQCQWANHEVATCQPVTAVVASARAAGVLVHTDAAAAAGHVPIDLGALGDLAPDLVSVSGHKFGGPTGVGALVLRRGLRLEPLLAGGQQERARRAGMENVLGIVGLGAAAAALDPATLAAESAAAREQTRQLVSLATAVEGVVQIGDTDDRLPHIVCVGVEGVEAEPVLLGLDRAGIAAHSGSACASESLEPSPVLAAMGADPSHSLRLSVGWLTTADDITAFGVAFRRVVQELRALRT